MMSDGTMPDDAAAPVTPCGTIAVQGDISRSIFAHAGGALIATSLDGGITAFNPAAEDLLGYAESDMVGKATPLVFHDADEVAARAARLSDEYGEPITGLAAFVRPLEDQAAHTYLRKDGRRVPVMLTVSILRDESGRPVGHLGVARDRSDSFKQQDREQAAAGASAGRGTGLQLIDSPTRQIRGASSFATKDGLPGVSIRWSER